jgi:PleD family two-component response regulator
MSVKKIWHGWKNFGRRWPPSLCNVQSVRLRFYVSKKSMNHSADSAAPVPDIYNHDARACVLVVDDQPLNIALVRQFLSGDYAVLAAGSGTAALALCRSQKPDLILLDVMMPEMSGHEVCERLADDLETRHIPVIFITSNFGPDEEAHGLSLGAVDFIAKPLNPAVLKARVRTQLMLKRQSDQLRENEARLLLAASASDPARGHQRLPAPG